MVLAGLWVGVALHAFKRANNQGWILQRHGYRAPAQVPAPSDRPRLGRLTHAPGLKSMDRYTSAYDGGRLDNSTLAARPPTL